MRLSPAIACCGILIVTFGRTAGGQTFRPLSYNRLGDTASSLPMLRFNDTLHVPLFRLAPLPGAAIGRGTDLAVAHSSALQCPMPVFALESTERSRMPVVAPDTIHADRMPTMRDLCTNPLRFGPGWR